MERERQEQQEQQQQQKQQPEEVVLESPEHDEEGTAAHIVEDRYDDGALRSWASEGVRRVRADKVMSYMQLLTGMAAIGGFLFGYDTGVISGAMLPIKRQFNLNPDQQEVVVASTVFAAFFSSLAGGTLNASYGRRYSILVASSIFTFGSLWLLIAWSYYSLVFGRIVIGIGIGIASLTTPIYIAEVALPRIRGRLVTINAFLVTFGQFTAGMVDGLFDEIMPNTGWRFMLGLAAIPAIIMYIGFYYYLPESPRYLAMEGNRKEALEVLKTLRESDEDAEIELIEILDSVVDSTISRTNNDGDDDGGGYDNDGDDGALQIPEDDDDLADIGEQEEAGVNTTTTGVSTTANTSAITTTMKQIESTLFQYYDMITDAPTRRALILGCGLMVVQQCSGINTVMYYAASIYEMSQFSETASVWLSGFTALAQVAGIGLSIFLVDHTGRRTLVLISLFFVTLSLLGLGFSFYLARISSESVHNAIGDTCEKQPATVWDGVTTYCYDCTSIPTCGYCGGMCVPGNSTQPFDVDLCPIHSEWTYNSCKNPYGWLSVIFMILYLLGKWS